MPLRVSISRWWIWCQLSESSHRQESVYLVAEDDAVRAPWVERRAPFEWRRGGRRCFLKIFESSMWLSVVWNCRAIVWVVFWRDEQLGVDVLCWLCHGMASQLAGSGVPRQVGFARSMGAGSFSSRLGPQNLEPRGLREPTRSQRDPGPNRVSGRSAPAGSLGLHTCAVSPT